MIELPGDVFASPAVAARADASKNRTAIGSGRGSGRDIGRPDVIPRFDPSRWRTYDETRRCSINSEKNPAVTRATTAHSRPQVPAREAPPPLADQRAREPARSSLGPRGAALPAGRRARARPGPA